MEIFELSFKIASLGITIGVFFGLSVLAIRGLFDTLNTVSK